MDFEDIEKEKGDEFRKIFLLTKELVSRLEKKGIRISPREKDTRYAQFVTSEELIIHNVTYFLSCYSNSGLYYNLELGLKLISELRTVGLQGCAVALQKLVPLSDEEEAREKADEDNGASDDEYLRWLDDWEARVLRIEEEAENDEVASSIVWNFAVLNRDRILRSSID